MDPTRGDDASLTRTAMPGAEAGDVSRLPASWGDFRILGQLGRGGFGHVYRAWDAALAREVALKVVTLRDASRRADALREAQMLARVRHQNVITVHSVHQADDEVGMVMDLIRGDTLAD